MRDMVDAKKTIAQLVTRLIHENRELWDELKQDMSAGAIPDLYGSHIGLVFQAASQRVLSQLPESEQKALRAYACSHLPSGFPDRSASALIVGEVMTRAGRVVSRYG